MTFSLLILTLTINSQSDLPQKYYNSSLFAPLKETFHTFYLFPFIQCGVNVLVHVRDLEKVDSSSPLPQKTLLLNT